MAIKPTYPKWIPGAEAARITDPGEVKRALGYVYQEKPPFQHFNWGMYNLSQWVLGLQGSFFDIVVGSAAQVTANEATNVIANLIDANVPAGSRVLILDGTHTLLADMALSNTDLMVIAESPAAIIDVSTFQILLTGARQLLTSRVTNAGANDIQLSGAGSYFEGVDVDISFVQVSNGSHARTTGTNGGMIPLVGPNITNFQKGVTAYIDNDVGAVATSFDIQSGLVASQWEAVGPTGSGAANIWTAMDVIPVNAISAKLKIISDINGSTVSTNYAIDVYGRSTGSSAGADNRSIISRAYFTTSSSVGVGSDSDVSIVSVPLDSSRRLDLRYSVAGAGASANIFAYLVGFEI